jgi:cellulose synthase/poly-beta-1,6-N-acetylglucosamine synthase-like glycosyltransferase
VCPAAAGRAKGTPLPPTRLDALPPLVDDPFVTVVMPVRNEAAFIERSVGSVLAQDHPADRYEVIVVDGDSDDDTPARVRALATQAGPTRVTLLHNPGRIVPSSLNLGLAVARGDLVIRVDGHAEIDSDYISRCIAVSRETTAACVGGPIRTLGSDDSKAALAIAAAQGSTFGGGGAAYRTSTGSGPVDTILFGAYRREVFEVVGDFDEELVRNQDDEFNLRVTGAGGVIWMDPSIRGTIFARPSYRGLWRQHRQYGLYKVRVMQKHGGVASPRHLVPAAFVAATAGSLALAVLARRPWLAATVLGPYAAADTLSAATVARRTRADPARIALATAIMHTAYGVGTLAGVVRFGRSRTRA